MDTHKTIEKLEEVICKEIDDTIADGKVNEPKLAVLDKAVDILKDLGEIKEKEMGYSERYMRNYPMDYPYDGRRGRDGDGDGRYYERMPYGNAYNNYGYDRNSYENKGMMPELERMMQNAKNEQEREVIRGMMQRYQK